MPKPGYISQRQQAEMVPTLLAQLEAMGDVVTYLVDELGGRITIDREELRTVNSQVFVVTKSGPEDESIELTLEKVKSES